MKTSRLVLVTGIVVALVGLTSWWGGRPAVTPSGSGSTPIPAIGSPDTLSSTWYCAAGSAGVGPAPAHAILLGNTSDEAVSVRLTAFNADGALPSKVVEAVRSDVTAVDVNSLFGATDLSVMAESASGTLAVAHRLGSPGAADDVPCGTSSSDAWFFPSQSTVTGASATLVLFNPFSADAGVDITAALPDSVRSPVELAGIVVPAGTSRVIDLGVAAVRRDQFAVSVKMRSGRVVAETSQTYAIEADAKAGTPARRGLRLQLGVPEASSEWTFATGFTGPGVGEKVIVYNPNRATAKVVVQVTPFGAVALPPEPFELDVPANRIAVIDMSAETRIPAEGFHAIAVESDADVPVVVARTIELSGAPTAPADPAVGVRPDETFGTAIGTGTPVLATRWLLPGVLTGPEQQPMVFVHNPGSGIATVTVRALAGDREPREIAVDVEVDPGDSRWISLVIDAAGGAENQLFEIVASDPVAVESTMTFTAENDLSVGLGVPDLG